ncbi:replication initiator protein [Microviridae sp.]|nr:replication initiator protein [Microviridae sp.]
MACYHPLQGWQSKFLNENGKRPLVFNRRDGLEGSEMTVKCGGCLGCRLDYSRNWAIRSVHEASLHSQNCFVTLTFNNESLFSRDDPRSLDSTDVPKFMKRFRRYLDYRNIEHDIKYFHVGEYGEKFKRPHYHLLLFNYDFPDKKPLIFRSYKMGNYPNQLLYTSEILKKLWPFGHSSIGSLTFNSAAYVSRYMLKKQKGNVDYVSGFDLKIDSDTGESLPVSPECCTKSLGIGKEWFNRYWSEVYPSDFIIHDSKKFSPPPYYDYLLQKKDPYLFDIVKENRLESIRVSDDKDYMSRIASETIKLQQVTKLLRNLEND